MLTRVKLSLAEITEPVGLRLIESVAIDEVAWIEYRRADVDGPLALTVTCRADHQTVRAELWRPSRLVAAHAAGDYEQAIDAARTWQIDPQALPEGLVLEIRRAVADWLTPRP